MIKICSVVLVHLSTVSISNYVKLQCKFSIYISIFCYVHSMAAKCRKSSAKHAAPNYCPPYKLWPGEAAIAGSRLKAICVPVDLGWTPSGKNPFVKISGLKSHDFKQLATKGILKFCLRGLLEEPQRKTLFAFFDALGAFFNEQIRITDLEQLERNLHRSLALL